MLGKHELLQLTFVHRCLSQQYFKADNLAVFDYGGKRWNVYQHACNKAMAGIESSNYALPNVEFIGRKKEQKEVKEQILLAVFTAENNGITGYKKLIHIATHMESAYGGDWSVHVDSGISTLVSQFDPESTDYYVSFDYEGKWWRVYKNRC